MARDKEAVKICAGLLLGQSIEVLKNGGKIWAETLNRFTTWILNNLLYPMPPGCGLETIKSYPFTASKGILKKLQASLSCSALPRVPIRLK